MTHMDIVRELCTRIVEERDSRTVYSLIMELRSVLADMEAAASEAAARKSKVITMPARFGRTRA
jgi:hypothetical protein